MAASTVYDFNRGWLFGGEYVANSEQPGFDDSRLGEVTLPHTVTNLSWATGRCGTPTHPTLGTASGSIEVVPAQTARI